MSLLLLTVSLSSAPGFAQPPEDPLTGTEDEVVEVPGPASDDQPDAESEADFRRHSIGSSLFLVGNIAFFPEPVYDLHLFYSYRASRHDTLIVEGFN